MRCTSVLAGIAAVVILTQPVAGQAGGGRGVPIDSGADCPPGTTEIRPRRCMAPEVPPPSILDYRPRSTLVVATHVVPRAKFPAIDYHGHPL
jgi:uncharacterized protein